MTLGFLSRRRKVSSMMLKDPREQEMITFRVIVDSGPAARDLFIITVPVDDDVSSIRAAVASHIGIPSMCLYKVCIPWQAHYEASMYQSNWSSTASLLSIFSGANLDDPSQLAASGGADFPAYITGTGSLRARKRGGNAWPTDVTVRHWFPEGSDRDAINLLVRTAASSNLDWARPLSTPITLSARFTNDKRRRPGLQMGPPITRQQSDVTLVDISPDATVAELKLALLMASGRPAPAGHLDSLVLWRVDLTEPELDAIEGTGGLARGRRPSPYPPHSTPPLLLANPEARVGDYLSNFRSNRMNPEHINISAWVNPMAVEALKPRMAAPRFQYPMPNNVPPPTRAAPRPLPTIALDSPTISSDSPASWGMSSPSSSNDNHYLAPPHASHSRCCGLSHEGTGGLIGLGIIMSPASSVSDHGSSDDEAFSWPPTPVVGDVDDDERWLEPTLHPPAWGHEGEDVDAMQVDHPEPEGTPKGFRSVMLPPRYGNRRVSSQV